MCLSTQVINVNIMLSRLKTFMETKEKDLELIVHTGAKCKNIYTFSSLI